MHTCIPSHGHKRSWCSCPWPVNKKTQKNKNNQKNTWHVQSMKTNVTTSIAGLGKNSKTKQNKTQLHTHTHTQNSKERWHTQRSHHKWWTPYIQLGMQKKKFSTNSKFCYLAQTNTTESTDPWYSYGPESKLYGTWLYITCIFNFTLCLHVKFRDCVCWKTPDKLIYNTCETRPLSVLVASLLIQNGWCSKLKRLKTSGDNCCIPSFSWSSEGKLPGSSK